MVTCPMLFILSAAYIVWLTCIGRAENAEGVKFGSRLRIGMELALALLLAAAHFALFPAREVYDDGGIILRYMDNFALGHFFVYNPADGPIYGVSGFVHGIVAGFLSWTRICSPDNSVLVSNFGGLVLTGWMLLRIFSHYFGNRAAILPAWALAMLMSRYLLITAKQGLETPLHLGIVLTAVYFCLSRKDYLFWLFAALSVISKLDAVPVIALLAGWHVIRNIRRAWPVSIRRPFYLAPIACFAAPMTAWIVFSCRVFGSPMPQSAFAKLHYHGHPGSSWFPFIEPLLTGKLAVFTVTVIAVLVAHIVVLTWQRRPAEIPRQCILGLGALATLVLYYFYNPGEQMPWYYAMIDLFLTAQCVLSIFLALSYLLTSHRLKYAGFLALAGYSVVIWPELTTRIEAHAHHFNIIESERIAVGRWIHEASQAEDVVLTGHGHVARECRRYVIDFSGLNSVLATDLGRDIEHIVKHAQPDWIAWGGILPTPAQMQGGYKLARSFYGISTAEATSASRAFRKGQPWRIYRRTASQQNRHDVCIGPEQITCDGTVETNGATHVTGTVASFGTGEAPVACESFCMGIQRSNRNQELLVSVFDADGAVSFRRRLTVERVDRDDFVDGYAMTCRYDLAAVPAVSRIEVRRIPDDAGSFVLIAPILSGVDL
jgi:hypothetical protein